MLSSSWDGRPFDHNKHGTKIGGLCAYGESWILCNTMWPGPMPTFVPSGILIHLAVWPQQPWAENLEALPRRGLELCTHQKQCRLGQGLPPYQVASWSIQPFGHKRYGPKIGGCVPLGEGELGPHLSQCGPRPTCMLSFILIHPTVWPQYTKVKDSTDRTGQDRQTDRQTRVWWYRANRITNGRPKIFKSRPNLNNTLLLPRDT